MALWGIGSAIIISVIIVPDVTVLLAGFIRFRPSPPEKEENLCSLMFHRWPTCPLVMLPGWHYRAHRSTAYGFVYLFFDKNVLHRVRVCVCVWAYRCLPSTSNEKHVFGVKRNRKWKSNGSAFASSRDFGPGQCELSSSC